MSIPGLPALPPSVNIIADVVLLIQDAINFSVGFAGSQWGIFKDGVPVVEADSVTALGFKNDFSISTMPVEDGGFQSYNKVNNPYASRIRFTSGGSQSNREALLDSIQSIAGNLELYDIVTPEVVYTSANIASFEYNRTSNNGVGMIQVDVRITEVRVTATAEFSNTQSPTAASQSNNGTVQPQSVPGNIEIRPIQ